MGLPLSLSSTVLTVLPLFGYSVFKLKTLVQGEYDDLKISYLVACDDGCFCRVW